MPVKKQAAARKQKVRSQSTSSAPKDRATQYALDVRDGKIVTGKPVRLACLRHLSDIEHQKETGLRWRPDLSERVINFFAENLTIEVNDEVVPFILLPFQCFIAGSLIGWLNADNTRRFKTGFMEAGKGCGKTPFAAGLGHYGLLADGRLSPEIYCAATMTKQAEIAWKDAKAMAERSPALAAELEIGATAIFYPGRNGVYRAVSSEHKGLDGKRPHMAIIDEIHEHPNAMVCDKMKKGTKGDLNALIIEITNSGSDLESVCYHHHQYSLSVLDGTIKDDAWFAYVCALDEKTKEHPGDDWMNDESCWPKTNPGLPYGLPPIQYLRKEVNEAKGMPSQRNIAARLNFCVWTQTHELWIPIEKWEGCSEQFDPEALIGEPCWPGIDLSDKLDLSAVVAVFKYLLEREIKVEVAVKQEPGQTTADQEPEKKTININFGINLLPFFFIPEETMYIREKEDKVPYSDWVKQGYVIATPGPIIDYDYIYETVRKELAVKFSVQQIGYDPRGATQLARQLGESGLEMVELTQGYNNMSEPSQIFEALIQAGRVRHNGNPVLRWNVQNAAVKHSKDNRMIIPYKSHQRKRIDGVTAAVMGLGRAMVAPSDGFGSSVYETRGVRSVGLNANS
jgi:phage terminase large subunit-like protein